MKKLSGKASKFDYGANTLFITKYSPKVTRKLADTTDTADYDPANDILRESYIPVRVGMELSVEGNMDLDKIPTTLFTDVLNGGAAVTATLHHDAGTLDGHGGFLITDFEADHPDDDTVTWKATFKLTGAFTPNA